LRVALVHEASQVRAAALRAVRYLLKEEKDVRILNKLRYPCLISRYVICAFGLSLFFFYNAEQCPKLLQLFASWKYSVCH
jgi:hypothetical protein